MTPFLTSSPTPPASWLFVRQGPLEERLQVRHARSVEEAGEVVHDLTALVGPGVAGGLLEQTGGEPLPS